jgi:HSP20 family protein
MADLIRWSGPSMLSLQREIEDMLDEYAFPREFHRELDRLFDEASDPRALLREMDLLFEEFEPPPPLRRRIARRFENLVDTVRRPFVRRSKSLVPSVELTEADGEYVITAELPGMREQDVDVSIDDGDVLTIRRERREEETKRVRDFEYIERSHGSFSRSLPLPAGVDTSKIRADLSAGVLEIHVPKTEASRSRKIPLSGKQSPVALPSNGGGGQA